MSLATDTYEPIAQPAAIPPVSVWRMSVNQYHEMIRTGIVAEDEPVELLDGWLVPKMVKSPSHSTITDLVRRALERVLPAGWSARPQDAITLSTSEPEPDVVVFRGEPLQYFDRHPGPGDLALVVEIADSGLQRAQVFKKSLYAQAGIPVYWIVNLVDWRVEVYTDPTGPATHPDYRQHQDFGPADSVPLLVEKREVARLSIAELLPERPRPPAALPGT